MFSECLNLTNLFLCVDLCVSAALDAVKEKVSVPWDVPRTKPLQTSDPTITSASDPIPDLTNSSPANADNDLADFPPGHHQRLLHLRNFEKALKEISPSSSESLGTLSALRKWNEEFGEGQTKKKKVMWGKGTFGFAEISGGWTPDGKVASSEKTLDERHEK